jgi:isopenicillin-N epimerase
MRDVFLLRSDVVYLNHGAFGACPRPVFETYQRWQRDLEAEPTEFLGRRFRDLMASARSALAAFVGTAGDNVVFVPNATTGLNAVARSLRVGTGDVVLATDHEYGALDRTWRFVCEGRGAQYVRASVPVPVSSPAEVADAVWARISERTRVIFISHITSPTALTFPVGEICRRARAAGIVTVIDGAHAPGQIPVDLDALGVDFYAGNCHKWMCAPKGAGFLYARPESQRLLEPLVVSWGWRADRPGPSPFIDQQEWQGTRDVAAYLSVPAAIEFLKTTLSDERRRRCHALVCDARRRIGARTGLPPLSPEDRTWFAHMASIPVPFADPAAAQRRLFDEFKIEVPIFAWNGRALLRVSIQVYNTADDVDRLVDAVAGLVS